MDKEECRMLVLYQIAHGNRSQEYWQKGEYDKAILEISKAIKLGNEFGPNFYGMRGMLFNDIGRYDDAIEDFNKDIAINPNEVGALRGRGNAYFYKGDYNIAITHYNKVIDLGVIDEMVYFYRGKCYRKTGQPAKAIEDFNKAISLNPNEDIFYHYIGLAFHEIGNLNKAVLNYKKAARLGNEECQKWLSERGENW